MSLCVIMCINKSERQPVKTWNGGKGGKDRGKLEIESREEARVRNKYNLYRGVIGPEWPIDCI